MARFLTSDEINDIVDFIKPNSLIPKSSAISISNIQKTRLKKQLKKQKVFPEIIQELKKELKHHYFSSIISPGESVGIISAQSIGQKNTQSTLNSVDWEEKLLYKQKGDIVIEPIGLMIDRLLHNANQEDIQLISENRTEYLPLDDGYSILSCNENGDVGWYKIEAVTKHLPVGSLVKVTTESGREVTATQSKSFLVWNGYKFDAVNGSDVKVGDILPTTQMIPNIEKKLHIGDIKLCEDFGFICGVYLGNGCISFPKIEKNAFDKLIKYLSRYDIMSDDYMQMIKIISNIGNSNKIPEFAYNANDDFIKGLIDGFFTITCVIDNKNLYIELKSKTVVDGIVFLLNNYGVFGKIKRIKDERYKLEISGYYLYKFIGTFNLTDSFKQSELKEIVFDVKSLKPPSRDVYFDKVVSVKYVNGSTEFVYDLTVENTRNFSLFNGLNVRDTFHKAGQAESQVLTGVPRFQELLNATKDPKGPSCKIILTDKPTILEEAKDIIGSSLVELNINDISCDIIIEMDKKHEKWYDVFEILYQNEKWYKDFRIYCHCVILKLNVDKVYKYKLKMEDIVQSIHDKFDDAVCVFSPESICEIHVFFDVSDIKLDDKKVLFITEENCVQIYLEETVEPILKKTKIAGIESISNMYFYKEKGEWVVDTDGSNFLDVLLLPFVDKMNTVTNNIWEIYDILGIEATKQYLMEEFSNIIEVSYGHICVLVNRMTFSGNISSISRYTMRKEKIGTLSKSSFEETVDQFVRAASNGEVDECKAVSSAIVCGNRSSFGTGMMELKLDIDTLLKNDSLLS